MVIYPVPVEVTQAKIQLVVDQAAKAPPNTINEDLKALPNPWRKPRKRQHWSTSRSSRSDDTALRSAGAQAAALRSRGVLFGKIFKDLNTDFLGDRAFHPAHPIPEPDDFSLFFDVP